MRPLLLTKGYCFRFEESGTGEIFFQTILTSCWQDLDRVFFSPYIVIGSQNESHPIYSNPRPRIVYLVGIGSPLQSVHLSFALLAIYSVLL